MRPFNHPTFVLSQTRYSVDDNAYRLARGLKEGELQRFSGGRAFRSQNGVFPAVNHIRNQNWVSFRYERTDCHQL